MKPISGIIAAVLVLLWAQIPARGEEISVLTTTWIPYVYEDKEEITGMSTEMVRAILARAGLDGRIRVSSWNRAIITAQNKKDILIYPLMRIKEREKDFVWACPLFDAKLSLFKLAANKQITVKKLDDALPYTVGVVKGAAMHRLLLSRGFRDDLQLHPSYTNRKSIELLFRGRIDLLADNPLVVAWEIKQLAQSNIKEMGFSMDRVEELIPLIREKAYLAMGKGSSPQTIARLQNAWKSLTADGTLADIMARYD